MTASTRDEVWREQMIAAQVEAIEERCRKLAAGEPIYFVYRCPVCLKQCAGPGGHHMAGDDLCQGVGPDGKFHTGRLEHIPVVPA